MAGGAAPAPPTLAAARPRVAHERPMAVPRHRRDLGCFDHLITMYYDMTSSVLRDGWCQLGLAASSQRANSHLGRGGGKILSLKSDEFFEN